MIERAVILSTGDEITSGRVVDTNSNYLADKLGQIGIDLVAVITVPDVPERLVWAWTSGMELADVVLSTGGIGPTADDLTTETIARLAGRELFLDEDSAQKIRHRFAQMNRVMPENNLRQAMFPQGAVIIPNPFGTAPGYHIALPHRERVVQLVVMPGVPREMKPMMEEQVMPWLEAQREHSRVFAFRVFQTYGLSESALDEAVAGLIDPAEAKVSFRASFPQISLRLRVEGQPGEVDNKLEALAQRVRERIGEYIYGEGDSTTMEGVVGQLLTRHGLKLAVAESCTGGLIGHRLTNIAGASNYLLADLVTYSNEAKQNLLGVRPETLRDHGAVSEQCVLEMAAGARRVTGADIAVSISGVAGPDGGTPDKPVGTVCLSLVAEGTNFARTFRANGTREWIKTLTSQIALDSIRRQVLGLTLGAPLFRR